VFVHEHISETVSPKFTKLSAHVTYGRSSGLLCRRSDMLRISGFVDDVTFPIMRPTATCPYRSNRSGVTAALCAG